jgi:Uma2 family endonuclease
MEAIKNTKYTYAEYLELEENSETRHDYFYGEVFALAGTTIKHNDIALNTTILLKNILKGKNCRVNMESVKVEIKNKFHYTYPGVVVSCSDKEDDPKTLKYPAIIVEVLSDSTRKYDFNEKFASFKQLDSLKHYILIEQEKCFVTVYTKHNDLWVHQAYSELINTIPLKHLDIEIPVKDIYEGIELEKKNPLLNQ